MLFGEVYALQGAKPLNRAMWIYPSNRIVAALLAAKAEINLVRFCGHSDEAILEVCTVTDSLC